MKKIILALFISLTLIAGCAKKINLILLAPYLGTYLPEPYVDELKESKSHVKASSKFRKNYGENPNVIVLNKESLECNYNFHEGENLKILENSENSVTVKTFEGKQVYKLEDNESVYMGNVKYIKINESTVMQEEVISDYLVNLLLPEDELISGDNTLYVNKGKIFYNGEQYEYGVSLVFVGHRYDHIKSVDSNKIKYLEVLDGKLNVYNALPHNMEGDMVEDNTVEYELECSFEI